FKTGFQSPAGRRSKGGDDLLNLSRSQLFRDRMIGREGKGTRRHRLPRTGRRCEWLASVPWHIHAGFSPRMRNLHPWNSAMVLDEMHNAPEWFDLFVFPQTEVCVRNLSAL